MVTLGVVWPAPLLLLLYAHGLRVQFALIASAISVEAFQNGAGTSPATVGPEVVPQLPAAAPLVSGTGPALDYKKEAETVRDALGLSTVHDNQPAEPAADAGGNVPIPSASLPVLLKQCEESRCSPLLKTLHGYKVSPHVFRGISVLFLAAVLWFVQFCAKNHPAVKDAEKAYDGAPLYCSTITCASHVLRNQARSSVLLLLLGLPLWRGLALAGSLRMVLALYETFLSGHTATDSSPRISGLFEILIGLVIIFEQEAPGSIFLTTSWGDGFRQAAPGLLLIGLLLFSLSSYQIAQWKKRLKAEGHGQRPALRLAKLPTLGAESDD